MKKQSKLDQVAEAALDKKFDFSTASVGPKIEAKVAKVHGNFRIDEDVLSWLKADAHAKCIPYQTHMNSILRQVMNGSIAAATSVSPKEGSAWEGINTNFITWFEKHDKVQESKIDEMADLLKTFGTVFVEMTIETDEHSGIAKALKRRLQRFESTMRRGHTRFESPMLVAEGPAKAAPRTTKKVAAGTR